MKLDKSIIIKVVRSNQRIRGGGGKISSPGRGDISLGGVKGEGGGERGGAMGGGGGIR